MRNITKTLATVTLLAPTSAYSLGIGDIKLHSALNQKLDAEIALLVSKGENVSHLEVRLASPEKFDEAGVPWNYFLSKIKFKTEVQADGSTIVKLSSNEALKEPFLDFLLEVSWDKGNLFREFTVLVDPPVAYTQPVIPVIQKVEQVAKTKTEQIKPIIIKPVAIPVTKEKGTGSLSETAVDKYGPVKRGESLWSISEKTNAYSDISREQMMMAIYDANPVAFHKKNINHLKAGYTLNIPEQDIIVSLSKKGALNKFGQQINKWGGNVTSQKTSGKEQIAATHVKKHAQLELEAPSQAEIAEMAIIGSKNDNASSSGKTNTSAENLVLRARVNKLEQKLASVKQMLALKNEQLANIQNSKKIVDELKKGTETKVAEVTETKAKEVLQPINTSKKIVESIDIQQKKKQSEQNSLAEEKTKVTGSDDKAKEIVKSLETEIKKEKPELNKPVTQKPGSSEGVSAQPDESEQTPIYVQPESELFSPQSLAAVGLPALGLLGWFLWRRKRTEDEMDSESMFASASEIGLPDSDDEDLSDSDLNDTSSFELGEEGESSLLSEFGSSDFNSFEAEENEVDPILESDVYLAYGRYQQAEDLMRQAVIDHPERDECKLKLLEIFHANENKVSFEEYISELIDAGKQEDRDFWEKVVEMGAGLDLDPELFGTSISEKASFEIDESDGNLESKPEEELAESISDDKIETEEESIEDEVAIDTEAVDEKNNDEMEFDLSIFDEDQPSDVEVTEKEEDKGLDFDLAEFAIDKPVSSEEEQEFGEIEITSEEESSDSLENFDFSLQSLSTTNDSVEIKESEQRSENFENFSFDHDESTSDSYSLDDSNEGISDLTYMDEMEAKIDLAKAYVEMEDFDSAQVIAEEVLKKGNESQKKSAKAILDRDGE